MRTIFDLIGNAGAGKSTVSAHLAVKYGFAIVRPSALIGEYAELNGIELGSRADYVATHALMRKRLGDDVFIRNILDTPSDTICVDGLRVPADVDQLKKHGGKVIALWCPLVQRFERRALETPALSFDEFKIDQMGDYHSTDPTHPSTITVMGEANYHVDASRPLPWVLKEIDAIVEKS